MDVSIGLPNAVPGTTGGQLTAFARRADERGFRSLGTIDRIVYPNLDPLTALAAAAAVTERIGLMTSILIAPLHTNATLLAKQALALNAISGGRLTLALGLGGREDDYEACGLPTAGRGERLEEMLERVREVWEGDAIGPGLAGAPRVLLGGHADASFERAARFGEGWIAGGSAPDQYAGMVKQARAAWEAAGRDGAPHTAALAYFALGEDAEEDARAYLTDYYGFLGPDGAEAVAGSAAKDPDTVSAYISAFADAGCEELVFFPSSPDPVQADLLADAAGL